MKKWKRETNRTVREDRIQKEINHSAIRIVEIDIRKAMYEGRKKGRKKLEMQSYLLSLILHKSFLVWLGSCWIAKRQDVIAGVSKVDDT